MTSSEPVISNAFRRIYEVAVRIRRGRVLTYGQVARLAGMPRGARVAGYAMRASGTAKFPKRIPWQRVVGQRRPGVGQVTIKDPIGGAVQRTLLEQEGVRFSDTGAIDLARYGDDELASARPRPRLGGRVSDHEGRRVLGEKQNGRPPMKRGRPRPREKKN